MRGPAFALLLLASCGATPQDNATAVADDRIDCQVEGSAAFEHNCIVEAEGRLLTLRKPDGGFRRLRITTRSLALTSFARCPLAVGRVMRAR